MTTYRETASAPGVWVSTLLTPDDASTEDVIAALCEACTEQTPVSAAVIAGGAVLYRDPSTTHGTPSTAACDFLTAWLTLGHGWQPGPAPAFPVLTVMGLREGYDENARVHPPGEVVRRVNPAFVWPAVLMSARVVGDELRTYREPGALIATTSAELPAIAELAALLRQERYIVADRVHNRTYAMAKPKEVTG